MGAELQSILIGTLGLAVAAAVALALALARGVPAAALATVRRLTLLGVLAHLAHFAEETSTAFYQRFPELLGLAPWPLPFFVSFNVAWVALWLASIHLLGRFPRAAGFPVWFLAIASAANGVVHPLLAVMVAGYFPGLWTSPLVGVAGVLLWRGLSGRGGPAVPTA